jgi:lipoprotein NlpI
LWLYIAAEQQGPGRGKTAIAPHLQSTDDKRLPGAILRFLDGSLDREALIKQAREKPEMERLNLAEAYFFIGQKAALSGQSDDAARWFTRTLETGATPYREVTFARYELQRKRK